VVTQEHVVNSYMADLQAAARAVEVKLRATGFDATPP
jgi:hypothetical protein